VFARGVGDGTDIVNKEMYTFADRGGDSITLRPEQTAAVVRSVIQNNLLADVSALRLFYIGQYFRYERPQKGRLREFHQFGVEILNSPHPESDIEVILLALNFINRIGIKDYNLKINSLGNDASRNNYKQALVTYLNDNITKLSQESQNRLTGNPLRILDSKDKNDIEVVAAAPIILDYLDNESKEHFDFTKEILDNNNAHFEIVPTLVRGLDYYSHIVFEFQNTHLGAQDSFGGGGRYNKLFSQLGGKDIPAVGFAMGMERLLIILEQVNPTIEPRKIDVCVVPTNEKFIKYAINISQTIKSHFPNISCFMDVNRRSLKAQMRDANKNNVRFAVIIGDQEYETQSVSIKSMQDDANLASTNDNKQVTIKTTDLIKFFTSNCL